MTAPTDFFLQKNLSKTHFLSANTDTEKTHKNCIHYTLSLPFFAKRKKRKNERKANFLLEWPPHAVSLVLSVRFRLRKWGSGVHFLRRSLDKFVFFFLFHPVKSIGKRRSLKNSPVKSKWPRIYERTTSESGNIRLLLGF